MRILRFFPVLFVLAIASTPIRAVDYKIDPTFAPRFSATGGKPVKASFVQPDGKIMVAGYFNILNSETVWYVARLNVDGTRDQTFNSPFNFPTDHQGNVSSIKLLPNGQYLVAGHFKIGSQTADYARLNSDGSFDAAMAVGESNGEIIPLPDGKYIVCGIRDFNSQSYQIAYRLNNDGSFDPGFRVTFATGGCQDVKLLPSGKLLVAGVFFTTGGQILKPIYRLNADGSLDSSFDLGSGNGSQAYGLTLLPDGKLLAHIAFETSNRFLPDGGLDLTFPLCNGEAFLPIENGAVIMTGCEKWPGALLGLDFARVFPDGTVDPTMDILHLAGSEVAGFSKGANESYYIFGDLRDAAPGDLARLIPDTAPPKAKFDFDGDGKSDIAVFRPSNGYWYVNQSTAGPAYVHWGLAGDKLSAIDFNRDGKTDYSVFRNGDWYGYSNASGIVKSATMGQAGDKPLVGKYYDYSFSDSTEKWTGRGIRNGSPVWFIYSGPLLGPGMTLSGELPTDKPVIGDFDGDSLEDIGYFRDGFWYSWPPSDNGPGKSFQWGIAGDIPVPADYDGDRQTDYAIFRPSTGVWWVNLSSGGYWAVGFGQNGDIPVPADYDGDGKVDIAVYRNGVWWQYLSASGTVGGAYWGLADDLPIPAQSQ